MTEDRTVVECDWMYAPEVVESGADVSKSVELFHRVSVQDFDARERTQPAMSSRAHRSGGVLVPNEHHISAFRHWLAQRLSTADGTEGVPENAMSTESGEHGQRGERT